MKYTASEIHAIAEVQTTFHWDTTFSGPPFAAAEALRMRCTTADLPKPEHEKIDVVAHGYTFPGPGIVKRNGVITLQFIESVTADIVEEMMKWHSQIYSWTDDDIEGVQEVAHAQLFGDVKMELLDKQDQAKQEYNLHKVIVTELDVGGKFEDGASPNYFMPVMTLEYAWFNWKKV